MTAAERILDLIRDRGEITPSRAGGVTTAVADAVDITPQRALQILRELERDGLIVIERYSGRSPRIARVARLDAPATP